VHRTHIWQRPVHDDGERIGEVARLECVPQGHFLDIAGRAASVALPMFEVELEMNQR